MTEQHDLRLGSSTTVIVGTDNGKYPYGNSMLVQGSDGVVLIDPSLTVHERGGVGADVDRILVSHSHEDHIAGIHLYPDALVHAHDEDLLGIHSFAGFLEVYGMPPEVEAIWAEEVRRDFFITERPDATGFTDGEKFELGDTTVTCIHLAGHTRGHSGFYVEEDGAFFVGDIDLTGFGPYYGDHWSNLEDFETAIRRVRDIDAKWYITFHHKGVVEGREQFVEQLDVFGAVIQRRESEMLAFMAEPRTMDELIEHRFVYRRGVLLTFAEHVERRTAQQHLDRFERTGQITQVEPGRFRAA